MIFKFRQPVPPQAYTVFTPQAVGSMVGKTFTAKIEQDLVGRGKVMAAELIENDSAIEFTIDWPDERRPNGF